jgi:hypothetical protein
LVRIAGPALAAAKTNEGTARAPNTAVVISDLRIFKTPY